MLLTWKIRVQLLIGTPILDSEPAKVQGSLGKRCDLKGLGCKPSVIRQCPYSVIDSTEVYETFSLGATPSMDTKLVSHRELHTKPAPY